jgi:DNA-binding NarL/FixJ family response regulator
MTSRKHQAKRSILLVDDDEGMRAVLTEIFSAAGFTALTAASGEEALELAASDKPALVVLEVSLPGCSGYEVCSRLRQTFGQTIGIVFLSGERTESLDHVAGLLLGADDYVVKPFDPDQLVARVRAILRRGAHEVPKQASGLTRREQQVLQLLAQGQAQAEIASELVISAKTVGTHIEHILAKLDVRSRAQAVALAYREDLLGSERLTA